MGESRKGGAKAPSSVMETESNNPLITPKGLGLEHTQKWGCDSSPGAQGRKKGHDPNFGGEMSTNEPALKSPKHLATRPTRLPVLGLSSGFWVDVILWCLVKEMRETRGALLIEWTFGVMRLSTAVESEQ